MVDCICILCGWVYASHSKLIVETLTWWTTIVPQTVKTVIDSETDDIDHVVIARTNTLRNNLFLTSHRKNELANNQVKTIIRNPTYVRTSRIYILFVKN